MKDEPMVGETIEQVTRRMAKRASESRRVVTTTFNDVSITANPDSDPLLMVNEYFAEVNRRHQRWEASPEGQRVLAERAEAQRRAEAAAAEGIKPFTVTNVTKWNTWVKFNKDPYGAACVRYAARWANLMEARMATGTKLVDIAKEVSHEADLEGITGFMYGAAVSMLATCWVHGEELRIWHNLKTQIGNEGEKANKEQGAVLDPALLVIGQ